MQQVYMIRAAALPDGKRHPFVRQMCEQMYDGLPGLIDRAETEEGTTLLFFGTMAHAEKAAGRIHAEKQIYLAEQDFEAHTFRVKGPVEDQP